MKNRTLDLAAAVATGREDAMLAAATLEYRRADVLAWATSQDELAAAIVAAHGDVLLSERARVAAIKARGLVGA
jgi:hypothetical protein